MIRKLIFRLILPGFFLLLNGMKTLWGCWEQLLGGVNF